MGKKIIVGVFLSVCVLIGIFAGLNQVFIQKGYGDLKTVLHHSSSTPVDNTDEAENTTPSSGEESSAGETKSSIPEVRAIYVTGWSIGTKSVRDNLIQNMKKNDFNAIVIDIKDENGQLSYNSEVQTAIDIEASQGMITNIRAVIEELHKNQIYVIGRIVTFKDPILAGHPSTVVAFREEDNSVWKDYQDRQWPNPYNKNSWEYPLALAREASALGFDEVQFDYVHFPQSEGDLSTIAYGFESDTKSKADIICDFLSEAMRQLKPLGINVSATVYGTTTKKDGDFENIGQDFARIASIVDVICPTVYPSNYSSNEYQIEKPDLAPYQIVYHALSDALKRLSSQANDPKAKIRPYLQDFTATWLGADRFANYTTKEVSEEIKAVFDLNLNSFALWDSSNNYCFEALAEAKK